MAARRPHLRAEQETPLTGNFLGNYPAVIDKAGRVIMPAALRRKLGEERTLYASVQPGWGITLRTPEEWTRYIRQYTRDRSDAPESVRRRQSVGARSSDTQLDEQGRFRLPDELLLAGGIRRKPKQKIEITIIGSLNVIEIWDRQAWSQQEQAIDENREADRDIVRRQLETDSSRRV